MFRESQKVFVACAIGAGIGSFVALEISVMFCWVGFLLGGLVGYLSYEWKKVIKAIPRAYRAAAGYQFPKYYLGTVKWLALFLASITSWLVVVSLFFGLFAFCAAEPDKTNFFHFSIIIATFSVFIFLLIFCALAFSTLEIFREDSEEENARRYNIDIAEFKQWAYWFFPPIVLFWHLPRGIVFIAKQIPSFTVWFFNGCILVAKEWGSFWKKFLWNLFLLIHSEMRILCGIDAMIGAVIGYFAGSALMGALYGGIVGVFNFLVITELCLKRIWRVIPIQK